MNNQHDRNAALKRLDAFAESLRGSAQVSAILEIGRQMDLAPVLVGGMLRDAVLGKEPIDVDLAVKNGAMDYAQALAEELDGTFVSLDEVHGSARVALKDGRSIDVTNFRRLSLEEDCLARDLTINGLAAPLAEFLTDGAKAIVDPADGIMDILKGVVRPYRVTSFSEDPLRILRSFRYGATLNFALAPETLVAIRRFAHLLPEVSSERVLYEFQMIFRSWRARSVLPSMLHTGTLSNLFPFFTPLELSAWVGRATWIEKILEKPGSLPGYGAKWQRPKGFRMVTMLAASRPGPRITDMIVALRLSRDITGRMMRVIMAMVSVKRLVREHPVDLDFMNITARIFLSLHDDRLAPWLIYAAEDDGDRVFQVLEKAERITQKRIIPIANAPPLVTGGQLAQAIDRSPGRWISELLEEIFFKRVAGEIQTEQAALGFAKAYLRQISGR